MTDKDILEEAKEWHTHTGYKLGWGSGDIVLKLISEVERLRSIFVEKSGHMEICSKQSGPVAECHICSTSYRSLTKELEAVKESLLHETTSLQTAANKHLKKQNAELNKKLEATLKAIVQVQGENAELREKIKKFIYDETGDPS